MKTLRPSFFTPTSPWSQLQGLFYFIRLSVTPHRRRASLNNRSIHV